jgi:hypothetical protein
METLKAEGDPRALGQTEVFDDYHYTGGRGKGYETWLQQQEAGPLAELKKKLEDKRGSKAGKRAKAAK